MRYSTALPYAAPSFCLHLDFINSRYIYLLDTFLIYYSMPLLSYTKKMPKTWVTAGASSGIGQEISLAALSRGYTVITTSQIPDLASPNSQLGGPRP